MATLLIVDDDNLVRDTLNDLLSEVHECHTADRAEQALAYLELESYDAVITDIAMPGLSGREILKQMQETHPATPVIVISGNANEDDARQLIDMGAFLYITKPFQLEDVENAVNLALAQQQRSSENPGEDAGTDSTETL